MGNRWKWNHYVWMWKQKKKRVRCCTHLSACCFCFPPIFWGAGGSGWIVATQVMKCVVKRIRDRQSKKKKKKVWRGFLSEIVDRDQLKTRYKKRWFSLKFVLLLIIICSNFFSLHTAPVGLSIYPFFKKKEWMLTMCIMKRENRVLLLYPMMGLLAGSSIVPLS